MEYNNRVSQNIFNFKSINRITKPTYTLGEDNKNKVELQ